MELEGRVAALEQKVAALETVAFPGQSSQPGFFGNFTKSIGLTNGGSRRKSRRSKQSKKSRKSRR